MESSDHSRLLWFPLMSPRAAVFLCVPGYPVQEDERNSTEERVTPQSDLDPRSQTGTLLASSSPIGPDVVTGTDEGRGRLHEGQEKGASSPRSPSSSTSQFQGLLRPTSHPRRRTVAGNTDREALLFPEETTNNRADTSGAAHLADGPVSASQRTRPYFQNTFSSGTFHTSQSTNTESYKFHQTQVPLKPSAANSSSSTASADVARIPASRTSKLSTISQDYPSVSGSSIPSLTSSLPDLPSWITWKAETTLKPHDVSLAPAEKEPNSWRSQRSTDRLNSDLLSAATSGPLKTPTAQQKGDSGSGPTMSTFSSSARDPAEIYSAPTRLTVLPTAVEALSFHPNGRDNDSVASVTADVTTHTSASESSGKSGSTPASQAFTFPPRSQTSSLQSAALATRSVLSYVTSPFTQTSHGAPPTPKTPRDSESVSLLPDWIITASSPAPSAASTLEDVTQNAAAAGSDTDSDSQTQGPTFTRLHHQLPTVSPTPVPHFSSALSSAPSHKLQSHTGSPSTHMASTTAEPSGHSVLLNKTAPVTPGPSPVKSTTPRSPHQPVTRNKSHDFSTVTRLTSPTTPVSEHKPGDEKEEKAWRWLPSSTPGGSSQKPGTTLHVHPENHTAPSSDVPASTTSQTPKFFIVPDQPTAIKGTQSVTCNLKGHAPGLW